MDNVGEHGGLRLDIVAQKADFENSSLTEFQDGDLVIAKITPCFENGKGAIARGLRNGAALGTTELHVWRPFNGTNLAYLFYLSDSLFFRGCGESEMYGAGGQKRVPPEFLKNLKFALPDPDEQAQIADFLDRETAKIDELIAKKRELIERLKEKRTALISHVVTKGLPPEEAAKHGLPVNPPLKPSGVPWLGDIPEHWKVVKATRGFRVIGSGTTPKADNPDFYGGDIQWVTTSELRETLITETKQAVTEQALEEHSALKLYPVGTTLIAMYGATIGRLGTLGIQATVNQACCAYAHGLKLTPRFMYYWLWMRRPILISLSVGGGQPNLSQDDLKQLWVPAPEIEEQDRMTEFLDRRVGQLQKVMDAQESAIEKLQEYRSALITAAVTGKIDVREPAILV